MEKKDEMKVLVVSGLYPSKENQTPSIFIHNQAKALKKEGIDVVVLSIDMRSIRRKRRLGYYKDKYENVTIYRVAIPCGPIPVIHKLLSSQSGRYGFSKLVKDWGKPDVMHLHFGNGINGVEKILKSSKLPLVITEHNSILLSTLTSKRKNNIFKSAYSYAEYLIAVSASLRDAMTAYTAKQIIVIPNIISGYFRPCRKTVKYENFTFLSVGNLEQNKRHDLTINAFSILHQLNPDVRLKIIGKGPLEYQLKALVNLLGLSNSVEFIAFIPNKELPIVFNKCHAFVLPSDFETFGIVYGEAAACGLPIIATNCGGPADIINSTNGLLVEKDSVQHLFNAMKDVYCNVEKYDANAISQDIIDRFGQRNIAKMLIRSYKEIL